MIMWLFGVGKLTAVLGSARSVHHHHVTLTATRVRTTPAPVLVLRLRTALGQAFHCNRRDVMLGDSIVKLIH